MLRSLAEEQQYSEEEIEFTLNWILHNVDTRFKGRVQSLGIVPYIIAEALSEKSADERKRERARVRHLAEQDTVDSQVHTERLLEQMKELPVEEQERLRNEAIKSLIGQGYQRQFVRDTLIKIEMLRLLKQE